MVLLSPQLGAVLGMGRPVKLGAAFSGERGGFLRSLCVWRPLLSGKKGIAFFKQFYANPFRVLSGRTKIGRAHV